MLNYKAYQKILSTKRGHKLNEEETILEQALRTCTNVKNRQTKAVDNGMEFLQNIINNSDMLNHKVLLFLLEPGQIDNNIAGLCANKIMALYQRPCCVLTKHEECLPWDNNMVININYSGSARGCDTAGVTEFKNICNDTGIVDFTAGHQGAFGLGLDGDKIEEFLNKTDSALSNISNEPIYYVDYIWNENNLNEETILTIADLDCLWGKDFSESLQCVQNVKVYPSMITVMANNTLKITLPCGIPLIKFRASDEEIEAITPADGQCKIITFITKANKNEWNDNITPQLFIEDYEIIPEKSGWVF